MKRLAIAVGLGLLALSGIAFALAAWESSSATANNEKAAGRRACVGVIDRKTGDRDEVEHRDALALWQEGLVDVEGGELWMEFRGKRRRIPIEDAASASYRGWRFVCP
jgi:hypothetical protein